MNLKIFFKEKKAQTSFEYLLTVIFAILLVVAATIFALNLKNIAEVANKKIIMYKEKYFKNIFG